MIEVAGNRTTTLVIVSTVKYFKPVQHLRCGTKTSPVSPRTPAAPRNCLEKKEGSDNCPAALPFQQRKIHRTIMKRTAQQAKPAYLQQ
jgi:hypothetical protein